MSAESAPSPIISALLSARARVASAPAPAPADDAAEHTIWDMSLVYGELTPHGFLSLLSSALLHCRSRAVGALTFLDLGSGEGAPTLLAAAAYPAHWCALRGIELVPRLHRLALRHLAELSSDPAMADAQAAFSRISFECDDMLRTDSTWPSEADVVFINGTCYSEDILQQLWHLLEGLRAGAVVMITSHELPAESGAGKLLELVAPAATFDASWGKKVTARVYRRRTGAPRWLAAIKTG